MEEGYTSAASDQDNRRTKRRRKQLSVFLFCIFIATVLWFLRAFENDYVTRIDHPVKYINVPDHMTTLNPLPQTLALDVKGLGFSILQHNWDVSKEPLVVDFRKFKTPVRIKKGLIEYLPMNLFVNDFSSQLKDIRVIGVIPDTLIVRLAVKKTRLVKVTPDWEPGPGASTFNGYGVKVVPDSILIEGPEMIIDTIKLVKTLPIKAPRQGAPFRQAAGLAEIHRQVSFSPSTVTVQLDSQK